MAAVSANEAHARVAASLIYPEAMTLKILGLSISLIRKRAKIVTPALRKS
jgi:hypothetical protein